MDQSEISRLERRDLRHAPLVVLDFLAYTFVACLPACLPACRVGDDPTASLAVNSPGEPYAGDAERSLALSSPRTAGRLGPTRSARLDLTPVNSSHRDSLSAVFAKEEVWQFPFGRGLTREETAAFIESQVEHWATLGFGAWVATVRGHDTPIGFVGLSVPEFLPEVLPAVEVSWRLDPDAWGHGYATEAAHLALNCAFRALKLEQVISLPQLQNPRSVRVAARIGMRLERVTTAPATERRGPVEVAVMVVTDHEWSQGTSIPTDGAVGAEYPPAPRRGRGRHVTRRHPEAGGRSMTYAGCPGHRVRDRRLHLRGEHGIAVSSPRS